MKRQAAAAASGTTGVEVVGHPMRARDLTEAATFARDLAWAAYIGIPRGDATLWLTVRARARRDLLWFCRNILGLTRLSETIHRPVADFITQIVRRPHGFGSLRDPRGNGKTSLSTRGGALWCLVQDPIECTERGWPIRGRESRLGIVTLKAEFTMTFMQLLLEDLDSPLFGWAFPDVLPETRRKWGLRGVTVRRGLPADLARHPLFVTYPSLTRFPDPTLAPGSLEAGRAGAHTHGEFIDDPVNEKTWNSAPAIDTAVHAIERLFDIVRPEQGFRLVTGNHWSPMDVADQLDTHDGVGCGWSVFLRSATSCAVCRDGYPTDATGLVPRTTRGGLAHVHDPDTFVWLMPEADGKVPDLTLIRRRAGSTHSYMAQYENSPTAAGATLWSGTQLGSFGVIERNARGELDANSRISYHDPRRPEADMEVCRVRDLFVTLTFDTAHGSLDERSSENAMTVLGRTPADTFLLLDSWTARLSEPLAALDELVALIQRFRVHRVGIDSTGFQRVIAPLLRLRLADARVGWLNFEHHIVPIVLSRADGDKVSRIRDALGPLVVSGSLCVNRTIRGFESAIVQLEGFPVFRQRDTLDALSMHMHLMLTQKPRSLSEKRRLRLGERRRLTAKRRSGSVTGYTSFVSSSTGKPL